MLSTLRRDAPQHLDVQSLHKAIDHIDDFDVKIYEAAKWYVSNGFMIVPFTSGGYPKGLSQHHATKQLSKVKEWWHPTEGAHPGVAIAMAMGGASGFCAVDLDIKADVDGTQNLADLQLAHGDYDDGEGEGLQTLMAITASGGRHLLFRFHPEIISNSEVSYPGIDTRGGLKRNPIENGGIIFVEPSKKPKTNSHYRWDHNVNKIIDMPPWLVDVLNGRIPPKKGGLKLQEEYIQSAMGDHGDGRDRNIYMDLMRFVGIGYTEEQLWGLEDEILSRMSPPDPLMVRRKIESAIASEAFVKAQEEGEQRTKLDSLKLDRSDKDKVLRTVKNLNIILSSPIFRHEYGYIQYDDFYQHFTRDGEPLAMVADYAVGITLWLSENMKFESSPEVVRRTIEYIAFTDTHCNAAREYMLSCPVPDTSYDFDKDYWGSGRRGPGPAFKRLCMEVLQFGNANLHKGYNDKTCKAYEGFLWFWLQGIVARACVPGCKMEIVLNLFGKQGIAKSTFFRDLCPQPEWFTDSIQDSIAMGGRDNKDELSKLHAKLIVEMPELSPIKKGGKAADDKMKQFISTQVDHFRRSYGQDTVAHPRTSVLCGTSNNNDIYRDMTGDRRFLSINHGSVPIRLGDKDNGTMDKIRDELWGELVSSFRYGELDSGPKKLLVCVPPDLRELQTSVNSDHRYEEIGLSEMILWMEDKSRITWDEIIAQAKTIPGLRDAKESSIMVMMRQSLKNNELFTFKKRMSRENPDGSKTKCNCWVNTGHAREEGHRAGVKIPPHWSKWSSEERPY